MHLPKTLWLTGLPAAGKSTLALEIRRALLQRGRPCHVLDGDDLRRGLSRDLAFSRSDRRENVRRTAEVARLFNDAGLTTIVALVSPYRDDRTAARSIVGEDRFIEAYLSADLATCKARDPKGHYARALADDLPGFTGVSDAYEQPLHADVVLDTGRLDIPTCVAELLRSLHAAGGEG
jgi:adenylylsulfate kinase